MTKTLTYPVFVIAGLLTIATFVTAKTYSQLALGVFLYPILIYIAFKIFPKFEWLTQKATRQTNTTQDHGQYETNSNPQPPKETALIADIDKRAFIKLIGATGISYLVFSILGRRIEPLIFGKNTPANIGQFGNTGQISTNESSPADGYKISEVDEQDQFRYFGFVNQNGAWLVMRQDANDNTFRYIKGSSNFPGNWRDREKLKYDYYYNLFQN